jgi:hypothetical protein
VASDHDDPRLSVHLPLVGAVAATLSGKLEAVIFQVRMRSRNFMKLESGPGYGRRCDHGIIRYSVCGRQGKEKGPLPLVRARDLA